MGGWSILTSRIKGCKHLRDFARLCRINPETGKYEWYCADCGQVYFK